MARVAPFEAHHERYEAWFKKHEAAYLSELLALRPFEAVAEYLPFASGSFDHALVVTTLCFVDSPARMLVEARRVLKPGGRLVIGFIDRASALGHHYLAHQAENVFYRDATFYSAEEVERLLLESRFSIDVWGQTLVRPLAETLDIEPLRAGYGQCAFVVVAATRAG